MYKIISSIGKATIFGLLLLLATLGLSVSDEFPLKDGRYVVDQKICAYNEEQIFNEFSDGAALNVRTIKNGTFDYHYESTCKIADVKVDGSDVLYTSICSAEGEEYSEREHLTLNSRTSFTQDRITFELCEGAATNTSAANELPITEPEMIFALQSSLTALGFDPGPTDGLIGKKTMSALNLFLLSKSLPQVVHVTQGSFSAVLEAHIEHSTGVKYSDFVEVGKERTQKSLEVVESSSDEPENIEPASGRQLSSTQIEELRIYDDEIAKLKQELLENTNVFDPKTKRNLFPDLSGTLAGRSGFERFLMPAVPFLGCVDDEKKVLGFYNAPYHVWLLLWINEDFEILQGRITSGFYLPEDNAPSAWYDLLPVGGSIIQSLSDALSYQAKAFFTVAPTRKCKAPNEQEWLYERAIAQTQLIEPYATLHHIGEEVVYEINRKTAQKHEFKDQDELILISTLIDIDNIDYLTIHTVKSTPHFMLVQIWENKNGELNTLDNDFAILPLPESEAQVNE